MFQNFLRLLLHWKKTGSCFFDAFIALKIMKLKKDPWVKKLNVVTVAISIGSTLLCGYPINSKDRESKTCNGVISLFHANRKVRQSIMMKNG